MGKKLNLINQRFSSLNVLKEDSTRTPSGKVKFICLCDCGTEVSVIGSGLINGTTRSCGCFKKRSTSERTKKDLTNQEFGRLVVMREAGRTEKQRILWLCKCRCGREVMVNSNKLMTGHNLSCGCLKKEIEDKFFYAKKHQRVNYCHDLSRRELLSRNRWTEENKVWRKAIYQRDDWTCNICNKRGGILKAHHLNSYVDYPLQKHDLNNGVCLCDNCHKDFHKSYGFGKNNLKQFESYKEYRGLQNVGVICR